MVRTVPCAAPSQYNPLPHRGLCGPLSPTSPAFLRAVTFIGALLRNSFCKSLVGPESCFFPSGPKLVLVGEAPMLQGRQECRPSDGPATLLSPMVATEICLFPSVPKLGLVGGLLRNC